MIGDRETQRDRFFRVEVGLQNTAVEGLADAVGGDEAEAAGFALADEVGGVVPPIHDEVGAFGDGFYRLPEGFNITVAEGVAHAGGADEGRVADDVVGLGPCRGAGVFVAVDGELGVFVGDGAAGDGVRFGGAAVPVGEINRRIRCGSGILPLVCIR